MALHKQFTRNLVRFSRYSLSAQDHFFLCFNLLQTLPIQQNKKELFDSFESSEFDIQSVFGSPTLYITIKVTEAWKLEYKAILVLCKFKCKGLYIKEACV